MREPPFAAGFWLEQVEGPARREGFCPSQATSDGCVGQEVIFDGLQAVGSGARRQAGCEHGLLQPTAPDQPCAARSALGVVAVPHHPLRLLPAGAGEYGCGREGCLGLGPSAPWGRGAPGPELFLPTAPWAAWHTLHSLLRSPPPLQRGWVSSFPLPTVGGDRRGGAATIFWVVRKVLETDFYFIASFLWLLVCAEVQMGDSVFPPERRSSRIFLSADFEL